MVSSVKLSHEFGRFFLSFRDEHDVLCVESFVLRGDCVDRAAFVLFSDVWGL